MRLYYDNIYTEIRNRFMEIFKETCEHVATKKIPTDNKGNVWSKNPKITKNNMQIG